MKLILCAGSRHLEGYKTHDVTAYPDTDYVCDLWDIVEYVDENSCDEIQFTHALEHFSNKDVPEVLKLIRSLLKEDGKLYIEVPNFLWHAHLALNEYREEDAIYYCFGGQLDEYDFHKTGFTPNILERRLKEAGFKNISITGYDSLTAVCYK